MFTLYVINSEKINSPTMITIEKSSVKKKEIKRKHKIFFEQLTVNPKTYCCRKVECFVNYHLAVKRMIYEAQNCGHFLRFDKVYQQIDISFSSVIKKALS